MYVYIYIERERDTYIHNNNHNTNSITEHTDTSNCHRRYHRFMLFVVSSLRHALSSDLRRGPIPYPNFDAYRF